jgi:FAD/FMN-containing dehydrogenase
MIFGSPIITAVILTEPFVPAVGGRRDHPLWMMAAGVVRGKVLFVAVRTRDQSTVRVLKACVAAGLAARPRVSTTGWTGLRAALASAPPDVART